MKKLRLEGLASLLMAGSFLVATANAQKTASATKPELNSPEAITLTSYNDVVNIAGVDEGDAPEIDCSPGSSGGMFVNLEHVIVQPFFSRDDAFQNEDGDVIVSNEFEWDLSYSPRIEAGYLSDCNKLGFRTRYWNIDESASLGTATGNFAVSISDDPDFAFAADNLDGATLQTMHDLDLHVIDVEVLSRLSGAARDVTIGGGIRYADIEHGYSAQLAEDVADNSIFVPTDLIRSRNDFAGAGPTVSLEYRHGMNDRLSVIISGRGSALFGEGNTVVTNTDSGESFTSLDKDRLVGIGDLQVGLDYKQDLNCGVSLNVRAVFEGQYWMNGGTGSIQAQSDNAGEVIQNPGDANMGFFGFVIRTGLFW